LIISFTTNVVTVGIKVLKLCFTSEFEISRGMDLEHFRKVFPCLSTFFNLTPVSTLPVQALLNSYRICTTSHRHVSDPLSDLLDFFVFILLITRLSLQGER
jgi:hypothetical protein